MNDAAPALQSLRPLSEGADAERRERRGRGVPNWIQLLIAVAALKIVAAIAMIPGAMAIPRDLEQTLIPILFTFVFAGTGAYLSLFGRDRRALALGIFFLLAATSFADGLISLGAVSLPALSPTLRFLIYLQVAAFQPYFFWRFVRDFPRPHASREGSAFLRYFVPASLLIGCFLFAANLLVVLAPGHEAIPAVNRLFSRADPASLFWPVLFASMLPAVGYALWQTSRTTPDERRRVRIVIAGLIIGVLPVMSLTVVGGIYPPAGEYLDRPEVIRALGLLVYPAMLSAPLVIAYAVLVHRALDVRLIIRQAIQYALARYAVATLLLLPASALIAMMYVQREQSLAEIWSEGGGVIIVAATIGGALLLRARARILTALDRRFFRDQYDARRTLSELVASTREVRSADQLATFLESGIDRALHLRFVATLLSDADVGEIVAPGGRARALSVTSRIVRSAESRAAPLDVDWSRSESWIWSLPEEERSWLGDLDVRLLVPLTSSHGELLGLILLGEKRSELPFSQEDRLLLTTIADAAAAVVEHRLPLAASRHFPGGSAPAGEGDQAARECLGCGRLAPAAVRRCETCGDATVPTVVPLLLAGKYRMIEQLGSGTMGVVYRAVDLDLDRQVAVKTLPRMSAREARRLRTEARAMAAVSHPNPAAIYAAESWKGVPMLVVELLTGGTLHDRLEAGALPLDDVIGMGRALLPALEYLHDAGILHRDIKPSNIGYGAAGVPKLLDFGLAAVMEAAQDSSWPNERWSSPDPVSHEWDPARPATLVGTGLAGTPLYLPPEALSGQPPAVAFDLWGVSMVLYEASAGRHPYEGDTAHWMERVRAARVPDIRKLVPDAPAALADFFADALALEVSRRAGSARELLDRLDAAAAQRP